MAYDYISNRFPLIAHEVERNGKSQAVWFHGTRYELTRTESGHVDAIRGEGEPEPRIINPQPAHNSPEDVARVLKMLRGES